MRRKITAGLILRKDGRYQRNELIGDKRRTFTANDYIFHNSLFF